MHNVYGSNVTHIMNKVLDLVGLVVGNYELGTAPQESHLPGHSGPLGETSNWHSRAPQSQANRWHSGARGKTPSQARLGEKRHLGKPNGDNGHQQWLKPE
ncbi:unnamed protein product [Calypogeia fissa]